MNKKFVCKHFNPTLNENVIITFYPHSNTDNLTAEEIECRPEAFVLENADVYSWNNDAILGLSNPMKCNINIKFDSLQEQLTTDEQSLLFSSKVIPQILFYFLLVLLWL